MNFQQLSSPPQAQAEVVVNQNFNILDCFAVFANRAATTTGLSWGYYGGIWSGIAVTASTITLTASATNYLVVARTTAVLSLSTSTTNWNDSANYLRVYKLSTDGVSVTAVEDHRAGPGGVQGGAPASSSSGAVTSVGLSMPGIFSVTSSPVTSSGTLAVTLANEAVNVVFAGPGSGSSTVPTFRALVLADIGFAGSANGVATLDGSGKVPTAQLPTAVTGAMSYAGTWNASTNSPTLASGTGTKGTLYKVATAGTTTIDGISQWNVGDSIVFDGTTWDKIDGIANEVVSVAGLTGTISASALNTALGTTASPLTTKGDLFTYSTAQARLAVGTDGLALVADSTQATGLKYAQVGYINVPINSQSANYTLVLADQGKCIAHPASDTTGRTWTIPANSSVVFPIGSVITFDNDIGAGALTIAITSDTLVLVGATGSTGSRTLAAGGQATALKVSSTRWRINGTGLT